MNDYEAALREVDQLHEQFYDQLDANGEGGASAVLTLVVAPVDAIGAAGPVCHWSSVNGIRPRRRW